MNVSPDNNTGWTGVVREGPIMYDLENSPLQIKTDSEVGSDKEVKLLFSHGEGDNAGGLILSFSSPPQYYLNDCTESRTDFPTALPSETEKMWTIILKRSSDIKLSISCNDKIVLGMELTDTTCTNSRITNWSRDVDMIEFRSSDTASDYYRPGRSIFIKNK